MISLAVIESSAASRNSLAERIRTLVRSEIATSGIIPRIDVRSLSLQEISFRAAPDLCIVGEELAQKMPAELVRLKEALPYTPILVFVTGPVHDLFIVEQLARIGADEIITPETSPSDFMRKVVFLSKRNMRAGSGKLVLVDGGKGGVGVTSVTAGLAEALVSRSKSVAVIDCDFETQDLSRFLQVRPFVNEHLRLLLDEQRPISEESVAECLASVWGPEHPFWCLVPVPESDDLYSMQGNHLRHWLSVLEVLDSQFDFLLIDIGCARGLLRRALYQVADRLVFVINGDPACFYASIDRLAQGRSQLSAGIELAVVENTSAASGLTNQSLREEFLRAAHLDERAFAPFAIPFCKAGNRWPGSGGTLYSESRKGIAPALERLSESLGLIASPAKQTGVSGLARRVSETARSVLRSARPGLPEPRQSAAQYFGVQPVAPGEPRLIEARERSATDGGRIEELSPESLVSGAKAA